jgi:hypothetical protein
MADFECLIAAVGGFETMIHNNQAKIGAAVKTMKEEMRASQELKEEMEAKMDIHQERMEAAIHSIWSELDEAI